MGTKRKLITRSDLRGIAYTPDVEWLLGEINRKGTINGWHFSSWWFDIRHTREDQAAMDAIIWQLLVNNIGTLGFTFNGGTEAQLRLRDTATFIGDKLNGVWWETIVKWFRSMAYTGYRIDVNDRFGLDCLYIVLKRHD